MAITSSETVLNELQSDGTRKVRFKYTFDTGLVLYWGPTFVPGATDVTALRTSLISQMEADAAETEIQEQVTVAEGLENPDKTAQYQTQADFDRRLLAHMMLVENAHHFYASYPFFQAVETRGGANANQRATYLGVTSVEYGQVEDRYNNVSGVSWFLTDEKNQIWTEYPSDDWL